MSRPWARTVVRVTRLTVVLAVVSTMGSVLVADTGGSATAVRPAAGRTTTGSPTAPGQWTARASAGGDPASVSCPTTAACVATGGAVVETSSDGGVTWSGVAVPAGWNSTDLVDCPSSARCYLVSGNEIAVSTDFGATWTVQAVPSGVTSVSSISCPTVLVCLAVTTGTTSLIATADGGATAWTARSFPNSAALVSCPTTSDCVVVSGSVVSSSDRDMPVYVTVNGGGTWTPVAPLPSPFPLTDAIPMYVSGLACPTTSSCTVVGATLANDGDGIVFTTHDGGSTWSPSYPPATVDLGGVGGSSIRTVACPSPTVCFVRGQGSAQVSAVTTDGGASWTPQNPVSSFGGPNGWAAPLASGLSCSSTTQCVAVGDGGIATYSLVPNPSVVPSAIVAMAATPDGGGYWLASSDGVMFHYGDAGSYGFMEGLPLSHPIVAMAATADGWGYWLVGSDGGVFAFGDARFFGSTGGRTLNAPIVGMATSGAGAFNGDGYWLVASDGGVFAFGVAPFQGSMGGTPLNRPVVGISADPATSGYWLVGADGGVFSFGAPFLGSTGNIVLHQPMVGTESDPQGAGYRFVAADGGVFSFGLPFFGSMGGSTINRPMVGMAAAGDTGYWTVAADGGVFSFGGAQFFGSPA